MNVRVSLHTNPLPAKKEIIMNTFDRQAMIDRSDREHDEYVEKLRLKQRGDIVPILALLSLALLCMSFGFLVARFI